MITNKKGLIEISAILLVKIILALIIILLVTSFFTEVIPFFSKINFFGKIMILAALFALYGNIIWVLFDLRMSRVH